MSDAYRKIWDQAVDDVPCAARTNIGYDPVEAFRLAVIGFVQKIATDSDRMAAMAGVGGVETAGSVISYLAANPKKIDLYMRDNISGLMDDAPGGPRGFHAHGCLTWHRKDDGKVTTPQDLRISMTVRDLAKPAI